MTPSNGWAEWSRHVLKELERLDHCYEELNKQCTRVNIEMNILKVKAGIWGLIGAAIPVVIGLAVLYMKHIITT